MNRNRRDVGFWHAVGRLRVSDILTVEAGASFVLGAGLAVILALFSDIDARVAVAAQYVAVVAALVGIVFAGLALVVSLTSDTYLRLLRSGEADVLDFFRPFIIAIGLQVATVIGSVVYPATARLLPVAVEPWAFGLVSVLFFGSCLEVVVLTRSVLLHAKLRSRFGEVRDLQAERDKKQQRGA